MKILRSIIVGAIILAVMLSAFSLAVVDDKRKENGLDAIVFLMRELNEQDPEVISNVYGCGWFDYVFKIKRNSNGGEETYRVTKQDADYPWEYKSVQMTSHSVVEGKNMTVFDEWDSESYEWLVMNLKNMDFRTTGENTETIDDQSGKTDVYQTLQKGSKGDKVVKLQNRLNELGYSVGKADGDYGNKTKAAVEQFQKDNRLDVTGIADEKTQELLYSEETASSNNESDSDVVPEQSAETNEASLIAAGIKYISKSVMEIAPTLLGVSEDQCKITEIYYQDKDNNNYQFTARVSRGGPGGYGIGKALVITPKGNDWEISDSNHITMYGGSDIIPGELVFGDANEASIARGMQILGKELEKVDVNGDGELSMDEIFKMN